ncbi:hypothetical protein [Devosia sp.]|uniref:hypothetical protein n=1 Tax=Devosia sp. TaxID=1871048 RepID=UPI002736F806|nr:hypothetical protein [Devosia sp.]MDP2779481.1 hypothetical protein [Devosia sp.]
MFKKHVIPLVCAIVAFLLFWGLCGLVFQYVQFEPALMGAVKLFGAVIVGIIVNNVMTTRASKAAAEIQ